MTTVDVPGVIIPSCHILHEQILCSATMAYNILGLCKCAIIAIYHIAWAILLFVQQYRALSHGLRVWIGQRTVHAFLVSVIQTWI